MKLELVFCIPGFLRKQHKLSGRKGRTALLASQNFSKIEKLQGQRGTTKGDSENAPGHNTEIGNP